MFYIGNGNAREQGVGVWVAWIAENITGFGNFHNFSEVHDSQSMTAGMELSKFEQVIVTARVTRKGDAMTALQGLEATSETIRVADNRHLDLIIE